MYKSDFWALENLDVPVIFIKKGMSYPEIVFVRELKNLSVKI